MKTDSLFFQIFKRMPGLFFEMLGEAGARGENYEFSSVELKQTAFRIDGVFTPKPNSSESTVIFTEFQFQKDELLYERLFSEIMLYLYQNPAIQDWQAVAVYSRRSIEQANLYRHRNLLQCDQVQVVYLEDLLARPSELFGIQLMQLIVSGEQQTDQYLGRLIPRLRGKTDPESQAIIEMISNIMLYKFPRLSREEIQAMFTVSELKQTRVYQEALEEGRKLQAQALTIRLLCRRIGVQDIEVADRVSCLSLEQLEDLSEALLDFKSLDDLNRWLQNHISEG